jgi:hypothetical protein
MGAAGNATPALAEMNKAIAAVAAKSIFCAIGTSSGKMNVFWGGESR